MVRIRTENNEERNALRALLEIKDSQIRISILEQAFLAADHSVHIGGCMSAAIPLIALFYSGYARFDVVHPTAKGNDMFLLSKGHAAALLASIYADLGYFNKHNLVATRSGESIVNGHPGPILPGVHAASGPLGQGLSVSVGFALAGKKAPYFDSFCLMGDGELQEGNAWEAIMYAGSKSLDNLCLLVDRNNGQVDNLKQLVVEFDIAAAFRAFGWNVKIVNGREYMPVVDAIASFKNDPRNGKPTVIICDTFKGFGGFTERMNSHKLKVDQKTYDKEMRLQKQRLDERKNEYNKAIQCIDANDVRATIEKMALRMRIDLGSNDGNIFSDESEIAVARKNAIVYDSSALPVLESDRQYQMAKIVAMVMEVFAADPRVVSIDSDLSGISGLGPGISQTDQNRAFNVGVAEANMSGIAEGFAALGYNVWNSTFCPFFDLRVLRRIAISYQERQEAIEKAKWLSEGHNLDITFLATASNLDTAANGATHMGNDDMMMLSEMAHYSIIDASCPNQLIGIMRWIAEGNRGLVYLRIMRAASDVLYSSQFQFEFGKGYTLKKHEDDVAVLVSSGRGTHECMKAANILESEGYCVQVIDMPSFDYEILAEVIACKKPIIFAEQNNGYIWKLFRERAFNDAACAALCHPLNCTTGSRGKHFIHSGTYDQLVKRYGLDSKQIAEYVRNIL